MKTIFFGTPATAVPFLEFLAGMTQVAAVVSQPDQPAGRSLKVHPTPVKAKALELGLTVLQPVRASQVAGELSDLKPDLSVVVAYGRLLKADVLGIPRHGTLNVHFSLLPKYRGAAPVQWSLVRGESKTGVTLFWLDEGMDTGPVFLQAETSVGPDEDAPALLQRLTILGVGLLRDALLDIEGGRIRRQPQRGEASAAPLIKREDARLSLDREARELHNLVRGMRLWPRAYLELSSGRVLVLKTALEEERPPGPALKPGTILRIERDKGFLVQCGLGSRLWFLIVQPEGKKPINAADFLNGLRLGPGELLFSR
jgi:methionyl-tRNA formyltransferase